MNRKDRIDYLSGFGQFLQQENPQIDQLIYSAQLANQWFTTESGKHAVQAVANNMLDEAALISFANQYPEPKHQRRVGIVMAGNLPLVGMHDFICGVLSGHQLVIKLSSKDEILLPGLIALYEAASGRTLEMVHFMPILRDIEAVIATGSGNTSRYFEYYFGKYPNIIRRNRTSVALLSGNESEEDLQGLSMDIALYFGMGCRSVSKLFVPDGYDFNPLMEALKRYEHYMLHSKYRNNYDYNLAALAVNKRPFLTNDNIMMMESTELHPSLAVVFFEYYRELPQAIQRITDLSADLQCVASNIEAAPYRVDFGESQHPGLSDFADHVDTMEFLVNL